MLSGLHGAQPIRKLVMVSRSRIVSHKVSTQGTIANSPDGRKMASFLWKFSCLMQNPVDSTR
jgi:hypothetical protein